MANRAQPGTQEVNALVALFNQGQYQETITQARTMTVRYPNYWVGWKMLGVVLSQLGKDAEALLPMQKTVALLPNDPEAHNNLGITLQRLNRLDKAETSYRRALQLNADYAEAHNNLGSTFQDQNRLQDAEASYRRALQIDPGYARAYSNLGSVLHDTERLTEAESSYRRALEINPHHAEAHSNLGNTLVNLGRPEEAVASYRQALRLYPTHVEAHLNLGNVLWSLGQMDEAGASYLHALEIHADNTVALNNLALLLNAQGEFQLSLNTILRSLSVKETPKAKNIFVTCVRSGSTSADDAAMRQIMARALNEPWGRPSDLAAVAIDLIKRNPDISGYIGQADQAWPDCSSLQALFGTHDFAVVTTDALLRALLESALICDIAMERFLTTLRSALLNSALDRAATEQMDDAALGFYSALAQQCFINEYVFSHSDEEIRKAQALRDALTAALQNHTPVSNLELLAVAAYFPLSALPLANQLLDMAWPEAITALLTQQIREPAEEQKLRQTIPRWTDIQDEISLRVQTQYEENPYPRWIKTAPASEIKPIAEYLRQKFPLAPLRQDVRFDHIELLVAGCGTGQHPIGTAQRIRDTQILAVDLSLSSLAYAKRKTQEYKLTNIEYAQADLLQLGKLDRRFDIIESSGVLHHLEDPWGGWQVLLSLLRPGGFMKLGFYSETARRHITRVRRYIAEQGYGATAEDIRRCRQQLIELNKTEDFGKTLQSADFFSTSACRDLLFHVQEQSVTLTAISAFLRDNHLQLLGCEVDAGVLHAYRQRFPQDRAAIDLAQWQIFENENPDTFSGMYQFWVQQIN